MDVRRMWLEQRLADNWSVKRDSINKEQVVWIFDEHGNPKPQVLGLGTKYPPQKLGEVAYDMEATLAEARDLISSQYLNGKVSVIVERRHVVDLIAEQMFGRTVDDIEWAQLAGVPDGGILQVVPVEDVIVLIAHHPFFAGYQERRIFKDQGMVVLQNLSCYLSKEAPDGLGLRILACEVEKAMQLGVSFIHTIAAGGESARDFTGYYTLARLGFNGPLHEEDLVRMGDDVVDTIKAYEIGDVFGMMTVGLGAAWKEHGSTRAMSFFLDPDGRQYLLFRTFLLSAGIRTVGFEAWRSHIITSWRVDMNNIPDFESLQLPFPVDESVFLTVEDEALLDGAWDVVAERYYPSGLPRAFTDPYEQPIKERAESVFIPKDPFGESNPLKPEDFETYADTQWWMRRHFDHIHLDMLGVPVSITSELMERFFALARVFPDVARRIKSIGVGVDPIDRRRMFTSTADGHIRFFMDIAIPESQASLKFVLEGMQRERKIPRDCATASGLMTLAFAQQVYYWMTVDGKDRAIVPVVSDGGFGKVKETAQVVLDSIVQSGGDVGVDVTYPIDVWNALFAQICYQDHGDDNALCLYRLIGIMTGSSWLERESWRYLRDVAERDRLEALAVIKNLYLDVVRGSKSDAELDEKYPWRKVIAPPRFEDINAAEQWFETTYALPTHAPTCSFIWFDAELLNEFLAHFHILACEFPEVVTTIDRVRVVPGENMNGAVEVTGCVPPFAHSYDANEPVQICFNARAVHSRGNIQDWDGQVSMAFGKVVFNTIVGVQYNTGTLRNILWEKLQGDATTFAEAFAIIRTGNAFGKALEIQKLLSAIHIYSWGRPVVW